MKILFIGGTKFVGRKMVEDAIGRGYNVSLFQRGQTNAELFLEIKKYIGERNRINEVLPPSEKWDVVVDTCGYHPESVKISTEFLKNKAQLYILISTGSVYAEFSSLGLTENSKLSKIEVVPPIDEKITGENYGPLKALCEEQVIKSFGAERSLILRPTIIVGPYDDTKRFDYWIKSVMSQAQIEVPEDFEAFIQFIDVRAVSQFALDAYSLKTTGIYNLIGPKQSIKFLDFLKAAKTILNPELEIKYLNNDSKKYPMYVTDPDSKGFFQINGTKAYQHGLKEISVEDTIIATAEYLRKKGAKVLENYEVAYPNPIKLKVGDFVTIEKYETNPEWLGWVFCLDETGNKGWVSELNLSITEGRGEVVKDYDATELAVKKNEMVCCHKSEFGWTWVENSEGKQGWIPSKILGISS